VWFRAGTPPVPAVRVDQRVVLVSPAGPAAWPYGLRARVSSYGQKADLARRVARLAWWAAGAGGPVMPVGSGAGVRLLLGGNAFSVPAAPAVPWNSF
jgi:predicted site-specific integrase-resolvase